MSVTTHCLTSGNTKSCGCLAKEMLIERNTTHNMSDDRRMLIAYNLLNRCNGVIADRLKDAYSDITCDLGNTTYEVYLSLCKVPGYFDGAQIDRIDNNGNYTLWHPVYGFNEWTYIDKYTQRVCPALGNLRWATPQENVRNSSTCKPMEYYETHESTRSNFKSLCERRNWDFDSFDEVFSGNYNSTKRNTMYFYVKSNE